METMLNGARAECHPDGAAPGVPPDGPRGRRPRPLHPHLVGSRSRHRGGGWPGDRPPARQQHLVAVAPDAARAHDRSALLPRRPPGLGLSDPADFPRRMFRESAVRFVDDVLDGLGLESAVLAGASGGGTWALWYALAHPERVPASPCSDPCRFSPASGSPSPSGSWPPPGGHAGQPRSEAEPTDAASPDVLGRRGRHHPSAPRPADGSLVTAARDPVAATASQRG